MSARCAVPACRIRQLQIFRSRDEGVKVSKSKMSALVQASLPPPPGSPRGAKFAKGPPPSPKKKDDLSKLSSSPKKAGGIPPEAAAVAAAGSSKNKRRGGRASREIGRRKDGDKKDDKSEEVSAEEAPELAKSSFDCSGAIAQICDGLWVSAVSGTRMGASLEATLIECGVTAVLSTIADKAAPQSETFEHHPLDTSSEECLCVLHDACDFINEAVSEGGVVFIHSRSGFSRSEWAVLVVVGYMVKYQSVKLVDAMEALSELTKHAIAPAAKFRRELVQFEEEALGESSVDAEWSTADDSVSGSKNHSLSRRKLAENLNDRRLLKKKSPHK